MDFLGSQFGLGLIASATAYQGYRQALIANGLEHKEIVKPDEIALYNAVRTYTFLMSSLTLGWTSFYTGWRIDRSAIYRKKPNVIAWSLASIPFSLFVWVPTTYYLGMMAGKKATETYSSKPLTTKNIILYELVTIDGVTAHSKHSMWFKDKV